MNASSSYLANRAAAEKAVQMSLPLIHAAMQHKEVGESGFLYIVVMDPLRTPANASFEEAILYEHAVGDREKWDADYAGFARAKAKVAWRTGLDSHLVQELRPHLLQTGDTVLWGSAIVDGIVVGVSGANPWYDEAFAGTVAMCLRAIAKAGAATQRGKGLFLTAEKNE
jgi:hypothetical protein